MFSFLRQDTRDNPTARLMKVMHFGGKDLDLNRKGTLGESQKQRLHQQFWGYIITALFLTPWVVMIAASTISRVPADQRSGSPIIYGVVIALGCMVSVSFYGVYRHRWNVATARVVSLTGRIKKIRDTRKYIIMLINHHDKTERLYQVGFWTYHAFLEGETYTVYSPTFELQTPVAAEHISSK